MRRPSRIRVTGEEIESVTFLVDGRRREGVEANGDRTQFDVRVDPQCQSGALHRVTANVRTPATAT